MSASTPSGEQETTGHQVTIDDVSKTYVSSKKYVEALKPISLDIDAGEFVSVVGPSGCGKSTLLLLIAGLIKPSSGEIRVGGERVTEPLTDVGIVFQDHLLLEFRTAEENVLLQTQVRKHPKDEAKEAAAALFTQLGLEDAESRYPKQLSGGMQQRVSIARALIHDPSILMMDEPFGALDALTRAQMREDVEALWLAKRKTVFFITHSVEEAVGLSDRVIVFSTSPGHIVDELKIELPRPRPVELGSERAFVEYSERIYARFREMGVLK